MEVAGGVFGGKCCVFFFGKSKKKKINPGCLVYIRDYILLTVLFCFVFFCFALRILDPPMEGFKPV